MKDIGIDLGTKNVLIYIKGKGIILNEPSVVAIDTNSKKVLAVGTEANEMIGRTPGKVTAIRPMKDGVIADFEVTEAMLNKFLEKAIGKSLFSKPRILICCPSNITQVEKNAIKEIAERTGAKKVYMEEEPKVAAVGAGMDIAKPSGSMVIDIGGGTTDIAVLSLGGVVTSSSIRIAGNAFDNDIIKYIKDKSKEVADNVKMTMDEKMEEAKDFKEKVSNDLEDNIAKMKNVKDEVAKDLKKGYKDVKGNVEETKEGIKDSMDDAKEDVEDLKEDAKDTAKNIKKDTEKDLKDAKENVKDASENVKGAWKDAKSDVKK